MAGNKEYTIKNGLLCKKNLKHAKIGQCKNGQLQQRGWTLQTCWKYRYEKRHCSVLMLDLIWQSFWGKGDFLNMGSLTRKLWVEDLYSRVSVVIKKTKLPRINVATVTTLQDKMTRMFFSIHQESVLQLNCALYPVMKVLNFMQVKGLQHCQLILLQKRKWCRSPQHTVPL